MSRSTVLTATDKKAIRYTAYGVGGIVVAGGLFLLGRKLVNTGIANRTELLSFEDGTAATFAKGFKMAFENDNYFGWGTGVSKVRQLFRDIPSKEVFDQVVKAYRQLYRENLVKDLSDELTSTEYNEMLNILAAKPDKAVKGQEGKPVYDPYAWAKRLKAAFDYTYWGTPGTDEEAIRAVLIEIPSRQIFREVENAYAQLYASRLINDLNSELEWWEQGEYKDIINSKP